jgi:hypothetical protein
MLAKTAPGQKRRCVGVLDGVRRSLLGFDSQEG